MPYETTILANGAKLITKVPAPKEPKGPAEKPHVRQPVKILNRTDPNDAIQKLKTQARQVEVDLDVKVAVKAAVKEALGKVAEQKALDIEKAVNTALAEAAVAHEAALELAVATAVADCECNCKDAPAEEVVTEPSKGVTPTKTSTTKKK